VRGPRHKLGPEEITRRHPQRGGRGLKDLDESGIIRIGAEVKPGDISSARSPPGRDPALAEEKLLRAIFGEKAGEAATRACGFRRAWRGR